ncbi:hypothetical protein JBE04_08250 [Streptomyces sp. PRKS01-29]|nr:hypothetical protein [Streptomyces sabulosicollis]MBI0294472.1 hypothetical protein [Streptomyces sabulosicollis]
MTDNLRRPARPQRVLAALFVDLEGVRARYECLRCSTTEGPVHGADDVTAFVASIRTEHPKRCPKQGGRR